MNFFSNVLNSIPVVGHVKGVVHYAVGDKEGGHNAMYQATRTSAVLGGGAVGCLAGPAGAVAGAMYAGLATDSVASVAMDKPQGIIRGCEKIADDVAHGNNPTGSILSTGFQVGMDAVGGLGMGGVSSAASQVSEKAVAKTVENVAKKVVATVGEKAIQKTAKVTGEEVVKIVTKTVSKKVIQSAAVQAEVALVSTHVAMQANKREKEEKEQRERRERDERDRRERERREREERDRRERERREREERDRRDREREERNRQDRERREREERDRQDRERREREEKNRQDRESREREERFRQDCERRQREESNRQDRERRAREERNRQDTERREREERDRRDRERREKEEKAKRAGSETGSGPPPPPQGNNNNKNSGHTKVDFLAILKNLLAKLLKLVTGNARKDLSEILMRLSKGQIEYISIIIERLMNSGILEEVVSLVITIFAEHFPKNISFENFLSLLEFVATYLSEEISYRTTLYRMSETISRQNDRTIPKIKPEDLEALILSELMNLKDIIKIIVDLFKTLQFDIDTEFASEPISPYFRDIFSAVYHYYKHRCVPGDGILSIKEYFDWIRRLLRELDGRKKYCEWLERQKTGNNVNGTVVCDMYVTVYGRRIRIVVKFYGQTTVLSSCFVVDITFAKDKEGDIHVNFYTKKKK